MAVVYVYVMDTMADWETGHIMAELHSKRFFRKDAPEIEIRTAGINGETVRSMGGLTIVPDCRVEEISVEKENLLILPGSDVWNRPEHGAIIEIARRFLDVGAAVAAICGATVALAGAGILNDRPHTSNGAGFLEMMCPEYTGAAYYRDEPSVTDGNLITAAVTGGLDMAKEILQYLSVFREDTLESWYRYFRSGKAEDFFALMQSVQMVS